MATRAELLRDGFYVYVHNESWETTRLHYSSDILASGLKRLGAPVFANVPAPRGA